MKTKRTETKFKSALGRVGQLFSRVPCFGAVILICSGASAQNLFVSGPDLHGHSCSPMACGTIFEFTWDGHQRIFAQGGLDSLGDLTFDSGGNLFVAESDYYFFGGRILEYKPNGTQTIFASGLSLPLYLAVDSWGNLFVADYPSGIIYKYTPDGARTTFASGLYYPVGVVFNSMGNLFVVDNSIGNVYLGSIYEYKPDGSRVTFAVLYPFDRPADLAFDSMGNLFMADWGGNIYKYDLHGVRTTFGSVPNSAESLTFDSAGNLFVVDAGDVNGNGNTIYKFTPQGVRSTFAKGHLGEPFSHVAFETALCCQ